MIEGLKALEEYLQQNNLKSTLQTLRAQILCRIPNKPSQQFLSLFQSSQIDSKKQNSTSLLNSQRQYENPQKHLHKDFSKNKNKKVNLPVQGLLGKIAYSQKLMQDNTMTEKINHLMDNKIFLGQLRKIFPQQDNQKQAISNNQVGPKKITNKQNNSFQYQDQLDLVSGPASGTSNQLSITSNAHQISAIDLNDSYSEQGSSVLSHPNQILQQFYKEDNLQQQYTDDRDLGYHEHVFDDTSLMEGCQQLSKKYNYPYSAIRKDKKSLTNPKYTQEEAKRWRQSIETIQNRKFPPGMIFPCEPDETYPIEYNGISYDMMKLRVIYDRQKIGYEQTKQLELKKGDIIAGRYQVQKVLGCGVFAKVIKVKDLSSDTQQMTCFKMVNNDKDFFDQAMDQLKLLRYIKTNCNPNDHYLLNFKQAFYHRQHLFIETDLLKDNLLTAFQSNPSFFSLPVIKKISQQLLHAVSTLHSMNIIHADLKPQNIMIKSYNPIEIRVIDLGNGSFTHDKNLSNYVQSRSYRAPEVVLGCGFNQKIDIWSLGCIIAQLWTKNVLFYNHHIQGMLSRIQSVLGPWPQWMLLNGQNVVNLFSNQNFIYFHDKQKQLYHIFIPKRTTLKNRLRTDDQMFIDFIRTLTEVDPMKRLSAREAIQHPFLRG